LNLFFRVFSLLSSIIFEILTHFDPYSWCRVYSLKSSSSVKGLVFREGSRRFLYLSRTCLPRRS